MSSSPIEKTPRRLFTSQDSIENAQKSASSSTPSPDDNKTRNIDSENEWDSFRKEHNVHVELSGQKKNVFFNYRERFLNERLNDSLDDSFIGLSNSPLLHDSFVDSPGYKERNLKLADVDKGLEVIGRCLAKEQNVGWKEYWSFLGEFVDISSNEGLAKFEKYLETKQAEEDEPTVDLPIAVDPPKSFITERITSLVEASPVSAICRRFSNFQLTNWNNTANEAQDQRKQPSSPIAFHAYLCVEKSCQVFAKRLLKPIAQQPNNIVMINDSLTCELGRLKSLVCSYKEDIRFFGIDFKAAHSRFAHIIVSLLQSNDAVVIEKKCLDNFQNCLTQILNAKQKATTNATNANSGINKFSDMVSNKNELICLIKFLLKRLSDKNSSIKLETLTTEADCVDAWNAEEKCECEWVSTSTKPTKRNMKRKSDNCNKSSALFNEICDNKNAPQSNGNWDVDEENENYFVSIVSIVISWTCYLTFLFY